ncbi:hypothetical protein T10_3549 [Trichinella papuae]|uniref:Uncharacterized protein n=1 Tax=Trichinella papuae TaxID=268474 RepID=A0A0V1MS13_9BILA|nr:hypothetical protein T10_3549 [Trichinella papuae]
MEQVGKNVSRNDDSSTTTTRSKQVVSRQSTCSRRFARCCASREASRQSSEHMNENQTILSVLCSYLLLQEQHWILGCSISAPALICTRDGAVASRRPRTPLDIAKCFASGSARRSQNACTVNFSLPNPSCGGNRPSTCGHKQPDESTLAGSIAIEKTDDRHNSRHNLFVLALLFDETLTCTLWLSRQRLRLQSRQTSTTDCVDFNAGQVIVSAWRGTDGTMRSPTACGRCLASSLNSRAYKYKRVVFHHSAHYSSTFNSKRHLPAGATTLHNVFNLFKHLYKHPFDKH